MRQKVVCYITRNRQDILVFEHTQEYPGAGIQVPAGGVEAGESLEQAAIREAFEETGLELANPVLLGWREWRLELHIHEQRHFFWLQAPAGSPDAWEHLAEGQYFFRHRFEPLESARVDWQMDALFPELKRRLTPRQRVVCYVTRAALSGVNELLVFEHSDPGLEPGLQVVAGGIEPGENHAQAALRETWEEAGLRLEHPVYLGMREYQPTLKHSRANRLEHQHFYWLQAPPDTPNAWEHRVLNGEEDTGLIYRQRFVPLESVALAEGLDRMLDGLKEQL